MGVVRSLGRNLVIEQRQDMAPALPRIAFYVVPLVLGVVGSVLAAAGGLHGVAQIVAVVVLALPAALWLTGWVTRPSREIAERRAARQAPRRIPTS